MRGDSNFLEVVIFLLIFIGGIVSDVVKKNKAKRKAEEEARAEEAAPAPPPRRPPKAAPPPLAAAPKPRQVHPPKRTAAPPKKAGADDSEWLSTLADLERRDAAKAAAKQAARESESPFGIPANESGEPPQQQPFPRQAAGVSLLSLQQARDGFVLSEILGPPVSMRR